MTSYRYGADEALSLNQDMNRTVTTFKDRLRTTIDDRFRSETIPIRNILSVATSDLFNSERKVDMFEVSVNLFDGRSRQFTFFSKSDAELFSDELEGLI